MKPTASARQCPLPWTCVGLTWHEVRGHAARWHARRHPWHAHHHSPVGRLLLLLRCTLRRAAKGASGAWGRLHAHWDHHAGWRGHTSRWAHHHHHIGRWLAHWVLLLMGLLLHQWDTWELYPHLLLLLPRWSHRRGVLSWLLLLHLRWWHVHATVRWPTLWRSRLLSLVSWLLLSRLRLLLLLLLSRMGLLLLLLSWVGL